MFSIYDIETGDVVGCVAGSTGTINDNINAGQAIVPGVANPVMCWVDHASGEVRDRMPMPVRVDGARLVGLPDGALVRTMGREWISSGAWDAPNDRPGRIQVEISAPRYLPIVVTIEDYRARRSDAYPPAAEQLGALVKAVQAIAAGRSIPDDAMAVIADVDAVKAQHPKA